MKFNKQEQLMENEHEEKMIRISHPFALKMATLICFSVISCTSILGIFFGDKTPLTIGIVIGLVLLFGLISFKFTQSACM